MAKKPKPSAKGVRNDGRKNGKASKKRVGKVNGAPFGQRDPLGTGFERKFFSACKKAQQMR